MSADRLSCAHGFTAGALAAGTADERPCPECAAAQSTLDAMNAAALRRDALAAEADHALATLARLTLPAGSICRCRIYGSPGGGGHRDPITKAWVHGPHAADCPHAEARAILLRAGGPEPSGK